MEPESVDEFEYKLTSRMGVSVTGDIEPVTFVLLKAPTSRQSKHAGFLRQSFMQALREQMNNDKIMAAAEKAREDMEDQGPQDPGDVADVEGDPGEGHQLMNMVAMSEKVDYAAFLDSGKKLLSSGAMFFNGSIIVKENPLEKMGLWDLEEIIGRYIQNFINTSRS